MAPCDKDALSCVYGTRRATMAGLLFCLLWSFVGVAKSSKVGISHIEREQAEAEGGV